MEVDGEQLSPGEALLERTSLASIRHPQTITVLKDTASVEQALRVLAAKRVLSAPVKLAAAPPADGSGASIFGFVDVRDIVSSFFKLELRGLDLKGMKMLQRMRVLEEKGQSFALGSLRGLPVIGGDGGFYHLEQGSASLREVVRHGLLAPQQPAAAAAAGAAARGASPPAPLARAGSSASSGSGAAPRLSPAPRPGCGGAARGGGAAVVHRLGLYDDGEAVVSIVSQTDIVRFLAANKGALGPLASKTVEQLGWCPKQVVSVSSDVSAIEAMSLMNDRHISAVAVVDGGGRIIGNFSVSEMRTIMAEHFGALALPVGEFLALEHGTEFVGARAAGGGAPYRRISDDGVCATPGHRFAADRAARARPGTPGRAPPRTPGEEVGQALVLVGPRATFSEVVDKIVAHRIHRTYVVDEEERPIGCVTCTDVLRAVMGA